MKTILVIGGSKGIGKAIIELLIETHKIINFSRSEPILHNNLTHHNLDVLTDELPTIEALNGLVYCPGSIQLKPFKRLDMEAFNVDFRINVLGAVRCIQEYTKALKQGSGSVVLFSTVATKLGMPFHSSVSASKSAVEGLSKSLAAEYATQIRFNCIAPTVTDTQLAEKLLRNDKQRESMMMRHPLKQYLQPKEVAELAAYLLSDSSKAISGHVFPIDAGLSSLKI
ncbi:SDR family oxidoreductase [Joostella atrarenae]|uniref:SDR family oxidoreductase n=1 Tax=Joostella atrarenae TaxID=679257 RepID=A0ABS9J1V2_9FLAO|nr:SDR family oxidoreductase [Joostella atrarenae]MCF8714414.1 SDR family oxidoreductase [Joostella atrarenae]